MEKMRKNEQKIGKREAKQKETTANSKKKTRRLKKQFKQHIVNACKVTQKKNNAK